MSDDEMPNETQEVFDMAAFASIFRAYDIRGIIDETLTEEIIIKIGQAIGSEAEAQGEQTLIVGADGRTSSPKVIESLTKGHSHPAGTSSALAACRHPYFISPPRTPTQKAASW
jgi:phosphomannomutase